MVNKAILVVIMGIFASGCARIPLNWVKMNQIPEFTRTIYREGLPSLENDKYWIQCFDDNKWLNIHNARTVWLTRDDPEEGFADFELRTYCLDN